MSSTASDIRDLTTAFGIVVGGLWAYAKVVRGRTFGYRAALSSVSEVEWSDDGYRIKVRAVLGNTGSSKIPLDRGLRIVELQVVDRFDFGRVATWTDLLAAPIFSEHDWVEPGEQVSDDILALVARDGATAEHPAVRVRVRVVARRRRTRRYPAGWECNEIIVLSGPRPVREALADRGEVAAVAEPTDSAAKEQRDMARKAVLGRHADEERQKLVKNDEQEEIKRKAKQAEEDKKAKQAEEDKK